MSGNLLDLEPIITARLRDVLPQQWDGVDLRVGSLAEIVGHSDIPAVCPAVYVMPGPSTVLDADDDSPEEDAITIEEEQWSLIALLKFQRAEADLSFQSAGRLLGLGYAALHGWKPALHSKPMRHQGRDAPTPVEAGVMQFGLNFTVIRAFDPDTFQP